MPVLVLLVLVFLLTPLEQSVADNFYEPFLSDTNTLRLRGDYTRALEICDYVIHISAQMDNPSGIVAGLNAQGFILRTQDKFDEAEHVLSNALAIGNLIGNKSLVASALQSIALIHQDRGDYEAGLPLLEQSLQELEGTQDCKGKARGLALLGHVYDYLGQHEKALEYYSQSLKLREEIGDELAIAGAHVNLGTVVGTLGDLKGEFEHYRSAEKIFEDAGEKENLATVLNNIGNLYSTQANYRMSLQAHLKSLRLREELGRTSAIIYSYINIGVIHEVQGNFDLALEFYEKALKQSRETGNKYLESIAVHNVGGIHALEGRYKEALVYFQEGLKLRENQVGQIADSFYAIGSVYELMGDFPEAELYFKRSLEKSELSQNKMRVPETLLGLSRVFFKRKELSPALGYAERALIAARETEISEMIWASLTQKANVLRESGQVAEAEQALTQAIAGIESLRTQVAGGEMEGQRYFAARQDPYYVMIDLLVSQNRGVEALHYSELIKSRVLLDVLQTGRAEITKRMSFQEKEQEKKLKEQLAYLNSKLRTLKEDDTASRSMVSEVNQKLKTARLDLESFQTNLYTAYPSLKTQRAEIDDPMDLGRIGTLIDRSSAILEYAVTADRVFLFVITAGPTPGLKVFPIPVKQKELAKLTESYREGLGKRDLESFALGRRLYTLLLKPAEKEIAGKTRIIIVPDRELWELPFQAMQSTAEKFWIEEVSISYATSLSVLYEMTRSQKATENSPTLLAFGNPSISEMNSIPQSEIEIEALGELYGKQSSRIFKRQEAREATLKSEAQHYGIIHIASHGILSNASPMYSQVVLANEKQGETEDGLLEPWEVLQMDLNSSLVVLSACETGRGSVGPGEGLIGFTWALFVAGCPSAVVSQWQVDSESTTALMLEFHRNLKSKKLTKPEALRQAALTLLRDPRYAHPYYWAGFVVTGDPSPL